jgi:hypothetical protein
MASNKADTDPSRLDSMVLEFERQAGGPASLCADVTLAKSAMGLESKYLLADSARSLNQT